MMMDLKKKPPKIKCEVCEEKEKSTLHWHHIIPKTELNCTNHGMNLAVLCSNCHNKLHSGLIRIIGVFPSTNNEGRILVFIDENNKCNVPGLENEEPIYKPEPESLKVIL